MTIADGLGATRTGGQCNSGAASAALVLLLAVAAHGAGTPCALAGAGPGHEAVLCGPIESLPPSRAIGEWTAGGSAIHVSASTAIDEAQGSVGLGVSVLIEGAELDGSVTAARITVRAAGCHGLSVGAPSVSGVSSADYLAVGALTGSRAVAAGVAVALIRGNVHALTLGVRGLESERPFDLVIDETAAASLTSSENGLIHAEMSTAPADGETALPEALRPVSRLLHVELVDRSGAIVVSGDLMPVHRPS